MKKHTKRLCAILCIMMLVQSGIIGGIFPLSNQKVEAAINTVKVQMYNSDRAASLQSIKPYFRIVNTGTNTLNLSDIKVRYYYTIDGEKTQTFYCDYSTVNSSNVTGTFTKMTTSMTGADYYLEIGFKTGSGTLAPNAAADVQARFNKSDWSNYTQTGDYSYNSSGTAYADWDKVTATVAGTLVWGSDPAGTDTTLRASGDAYVKYNSTAGQWTIGTGKVEKKLRLNSQGQYLLTSFFNKETNKEYIQGGQISDEFSITVGSTEYTGSNSSWSLVDNTTSLLKQGEIQLIVSLQNNTVKVDRNYVIYPSTGVIQEWNVFTNISSSTMDFKNPSIIRQRIMCNDINNTDFHYMTGGANFSGSNTLKTVALTPTYTRTFDSYGEAEVGTIDNYYFDGIMDNKQGASIWNEFYALRDRTTSQGIFMTFDYLGHWVANAGNIGGNVFLSPNIVTSNSLGNGQNITTGKGLTGVFEGDVDDMGNTILDYVYRYKWDYTNDKYFASVSCGQNFDLITEAPPDQMPAAYNTVKYLRYIGADNYSIDSSWQDRNGDWNNTWAGDFAGLNEYINKSNINLTVWYPPWQADAGSEVLSLHPEYLIPNDHESSYYGHHLNSSRSDVIDWELELISSKQAEWGPHLWRYDAQPIWAAGGFDNSVPNSNPRIFDKTEDSTMIEQSKNFYELLQKFKDQNKDGGISGCSSGGELITIESARYSDIQQSTDGNVCHMENYWNSLITPPDKLNSYYGLASALYIYNKKYRGSLNCAFTFMGFPPDMHRYYSDPFIVDSNNLENLRKDVELYHYLKSQGVVGRWVKVYRPETTGNDDTFYMQKMNSTNSKGYIVTKDTPWTPKGTPEAANTDFNQNITIYPKGLIPSLNYTVSTLEGGMADTTRTGQQWMNTGITLTPLEYGEIIFLNIDNRPGSGEDQIAPGAPSNVIKVSDKNVGHNGIGITWTAGTDNNWISYYEVFRNNSSIDKVSKGTYYFDTDGSIGDTYEIRTVDGDGNVSGRITAQLDPEQYIAASDFSLTQGQRNWYYQQRDSAGNCSDMTVSGSYWKGNDTYCLIGGNFQHPQNYDSVRKWVAPRAGALRITGMAKMFQSGGDGVIVSILQNNETIWGPKTISGTDTTGISHDFPIGVCEGDEIKFIVNKNGSADFDSTLWDPSIIYIQSHRASAGFSSIQGANNWYYQERNSTGKYTNMTWNASGAWYGSEAYSINGANFQHPGSAVDAVRKWVAPRKGTINIAGIAKLAHPDAPTYSDGVRLTIKCNNGIHWGPILLGNTNTNGLEHNFNMSVQQGDSIYFIVNRNGNNTCDSTIWDPSIYYLPDASTNSVLDYSPDQGRKNWYYMLKDSSGNYENMTYEKSTRIWKGDEQFGFINIGGMHPGDTYDSVRKWVAPSNGWIRILGTFSKTDSGGDGVLISLLKNSTLINTYVLATYGVQTPLNENVYVRAGDEIIFDSNKIGDNTYDGIAANISIEYF